MAMTIKDVAKAAGVSVSTVSKVINRHYSISDETAERVRQVMRDMNYFPNTRAQSFASGSSRTVVLLADLSENVAFRNPHMFEIAAGMEEALRKRGYRLELRGTDANSACAVAEEIISRKSADAIAVHVGIMSHPLSAALTRLRFPHIVLGMPTFESQLCWIDNNNTYSGTVAASYLVSRGYKRIAFLGGRYYDLGSAHRLEGLRQGLAGAGLTLEDSFIWLGDSTRREGLNMTLNLLERRPLPEAIVCANNYIALGCVDALNRKGIAIPRDMGVLTFDNYPFSAMIEPPLTVVDINVRHMGAQAGKFLLDIIRHDNIQVQTFVTSSDVIKRASTK